MNTPNRALFIQLRRIGDVLMCTPAIRAFKKTYPRCRLDFLTELPEVLSGNQYLDSIVPVNRSRQFDPFYQFNLIKRIRSRRYDLVVDFFANPRSAYYSFLSGAAVRLSYGFGHRRWAYNLVSEKSDEEVYAASDRLDLLKSIEVVPDGVTLDFHPSDADRQEAKRLLSRSGNRPVVTLSPVSRRDFNRWNMGDYARIARYLWSDFGLIPAIVVGPGEERIADSLAGMISEVDPLVLKIGRLGLLGAIFERAFLHLGNDNGPKHIAVACGAPTFTIYGPHGHVGWTFPDPERHRYIKPADVSDECRKPGHRCSRSCIRKIPQEAVRERLRPMVETLLELQSMPERL